MGLRLAFSGSHQIVGSAYGGGGSVEDRQVGLSQYYAGVKPMLPKIRALMDVSAPNAKKGTLL